MLLRRRHAFLRFNITELILSVMTELSNLLTLLLVGFLEDVNW